MSPSSDPPMSFTDPLGTFLFLTDSELKLFSSKSTIKGRIIVHH